MKEYYVYILLCSDKTYYTGVTNDLERRFEEHQSGMYENSYTHNRRPLRMVYQTDFNNIDQAIEFEKKIKKWSKAKKEALINEQYDKLPQLAKKIF